jgi:hypothetical protein
VDINLARKPTASFVLKVLRAAVLVIACNYLYFNCRVSYVCLLAILSIVSMKRCYKIINEKRQHNADVSLMLEIVTSF